MTLYTCGVDQISVQLPTTLFWQFQYTDGVPCDSFRLRCLWSGDSPLSPGGWHRFWAVHQGQTVFSGVIDECEQVLSPQGSWLDLSGRGMAALLLDNEALGQDYELATLWDILRDHVTPYGISTAPCPELSPVSHFSVPVGSSEWAVLYHFTRYHHGISPRFNPQGQLILTPWPSDPIQVLDHQTPITRLAVRNRRYGVLSQIMVRDRYEQKVEQVDNLDFLAQGGRRRQVFTMPGRSHYQTMRYTGQFQLEESAQKMRRIELTLPHLFYSFPGELIQLQRTGWDCNGLYRVHQAVTGQHTQGSWTQLTLLPIS